MEVDLVGIAVAIEVFAKLHGVFGCAGDRQHFRLEIVPLDGATAPVRFSESKPIQLG